MDSIRMEEWRHGRWVRRTHATGERAEEKAEQPTPNSQQPTTVKWGEKRGISYRKDEKGRKVRGCEKDET